MRKPKEVRDQLRPEQEKKYRKENCGDKDDQTSNPLRDSWDQCHRSYNRLLHMRQMQCLIKERRLNAISSWRSLSRPLPGYTGNGLDVPGKVKELAMNQ